MNNHSIHLIIMLCAGLAFCANAQTPAQEQPPISQSKYTADPSARVFNNTLYVYTSHDEDTATDFYMLDWLVFSTNNLKQWNTHDPVFSLEDVSWANKQAWAPDCIQKNGKYYFYFPVAQKHIGVATGTSPTGPFNDALNKPLISINSPGVVCTRDFIDPCPFIDDDGKAYLFMGQLKVNAIELNTDMVSYNDTVHIVEGTDDFFEAIWMHKHNGTYYLSYASTKGNIEYATAQNPLGPYTYKGVLLGRQNSGTNHHSIVLFKGQWYLFYHNANLYYAKNPNAPKIFGWQKKGYHTYRRSVTYTKVKHLPNGNIVLD